MILKYYSYATCTACVLNLKKKKKKNKKQNLISWFETSLPISIGVLPPPFVHVHLLFDLYELIYIGDCLGCVASFSLFEVLASF